jgi:WD40 repeat protein
MTHHDESSPLFTTYLTQTSQLSTCETVAKNSLDIHSIFTMTSTSTSNVFHIPYTTITAASFLFSERGAQPYLAAAVNDGDIALWTQAALRKAEGCSHTLLGHQNGVNSVAFSSISGQEQQLLASGSDDCNVQLWDTHTKDCVAVLEGHAGSVDSVAFSPDSRLLASASLDCTVRLWDVLKRQPASPVHVLRGHTSLVSSVSFSPDGRQLASGSLDCTVRLWSVPEGAPGPVLQHAIPVWCVAFSPVDGSNLLASGYNDGVIRLWNVSGTKQQLLRELHGHSSWISSVAFSPDGSQLVSGLGDRTVRLWSVAGGKLLKTLMGHSKTVISVAFHPNGKQVASCADGTVRIWTVCEWSDRTHLLFGNEMKRLVFQLMCVRDRLEATTTRSLLPRLPIELWLEIFQFTAFALD